MTPEERASIVVQNYHATRCWGYDPVQYAEYERLIADAIREAVAAGRERAAQLAETFGGWAPCQCSECRHDVRAHAVDEVESMRVLAREIRESPALVALPCPMRPGGVRVVPQAEGGSPP